MIYESTENPLSHFKGFLATPEELDTLMLITQIDKYEKSLIDVSAGLRKAPYRISKQKDLVLNHINGIRQYPTFPLFMGIELEMEAISGHPDVGLANILATSPEFVIAKRDGSLRNGVEVVSVPATMSIHAERWPALLKLLRTKYRSFDPEKTGSSRCGMHIHMDRRAITMWQLGKMLIFINDPNNADFISQISSRSVKGEITYCKQVKYKKITDFLTMAYDKYSALNLKKPNTVELRIFRGTLNEFSFLRNMQFAHAYQKFCGIQSQANLTWKHFVYWVTSQDVRRPYYHLVTWLANNMADQKMTILDKKSGKNIEVSLVHPAALELKERAPGPRFMPIK